MRAAGRRHRGDGVLFSAVSRHGAVVTASAGGFSPAGDTAAVRLVNALYCRSVPEVTAPSLRSFSERNPSELNACKGGTLLADRFFFFFFLA